MELLIRVRGVRGWRLHRFGNPGYRARGIY